MNILLALLIYPGLALVLALGVAFTWLFARQVPAATLLNSAPLRSLAGLAALASLVLTGVGMALLPWPYHPASAWAIIGNPAVLWALFEGSFLLPLLPGFLSPQPLVARAAAREAQIGAAGRCLFWLAAGSGLWLGARWSLLSIPGYILLLLAGLLALPAAMGQGPYGPELSLSQAGAEEGLDVPTSTLVRFARLTRGAALLATLAVALLPAFSGAGTPPALQQRATTQIAPWAGLAIIAGLFVAAALVLRQVSELLPRFTLLGALRTLWRIALPLAVAGLIYLVVIVR